MHNYTGRAKEVKTKNACLFCYFPEFNSNKISEIFPFSSLDAAAHLIFWSKTAGKREEDWRIPIIVFEVRLDLVELIRNKFGVFDNR